MAPVRQGEHLYPAWLILVRQGQPAYSAGRQVGASKEVYKRWAREAGIRERKTSPRVADPIPPQRRKRRVTKYRVLDKLFMSPLGGYPTFLADYNAAPF